MLNIKSPICPATTKTRDIAKTLRGSINVKLELKPKFSTFVVSFEENIGKNKLNINPIANAHRAPPIEPSIDFFGEILSFNLCFPNLQPINNANISTQHVVTTT